MKPLIQDLWKEIMVWFFIIASLAAITEHNATSQAVKVMSSNASDCALGGAAVFFILWFFSPLFGSEK